MEEEIERRASIIFELDFTPIQVFGPNEGLSFIPKGNYNINGIILLPLGTFSNACSRLCGTPPGASQVDPHSLGSTDATGWAQTYDLMNECLLF